MAKLVLHNSEELQIIDYLNSAQNIGTSFAAERLSYEEEAKSIAQVLYGQVRGGTMDEFYNHIAAYVNDRVEFVVSLPEHEKIRYITDTIRLSINILAED